MTRSLALCHICNKILGCTKDEEFLTEQRLGFDGGIAPLSYARFSDVDSTRYAEDVFPYHVISPLINYSMFGSRQHL